MRHAIIAVLLLAALAGTAIAGPFEDAVSAYKRGDYATALREFRVLAEQGNAEAQTRLGTMYLRGIGVPQDAAEAERWYREAAEQGNPVAQFDLGIMYEIGQGVPTDLVQAYMWFSLAAAQGHVVVGVIRDEVAERMTPAQIAEAQRLAREWKPK